MWQNTYCKCFCLLVYVKKHSCCQHESVPLCPAPGTLHGYQIVSQCSGKSAGGCCVLALEVFSIILAWVHFVHASYHDYRAVLEKPMWKILFWRSGRKAKPVWSCPFPLCSLELHIVGAVLKQDPFLLACLVVPEMISAIHEARNLTKRV